MKIADVEFLLAEVPCYAPSPPVRSLLVRLATDDGAEGWGEASPIWRSTELAARRERLLPSLAGRSVFDVESLLELDVLKPPALAFALETACWDLIGRLTRQPLCHLWGGVYRARIPQAARLPAVPTAELLTLAREWTEAGLHLLIVPATGQPLEDRELLARVADAVADRAELRLDAAESYHRDTLLAFAADSRVEHLRYLVDPLPQGDWSAWAAVARETPLPLAVARGIHQAADVLSIWRHRAAQTVLIDPERVGGITPARKCAAVAAAAGLNASLCSTACLGIASAARAHLAASTPGLAGDSQCNYHELRDDILAEPLSSVRGMLRVPSSPGLGIELDRAKLERYLIS